MLIRHLLHFPLSLILEKQYQSYLNNLQYYCNTLGSLVLISTNQTLFYSPRTHLYLLRKKRKEKKNSLISLPPSILYSQNPHYIFSQDQRIELKEEQNNMVSFPQIPQIDDEPPNDMIYFPQTSQIESESGSNLDSNEEEEISVKRKMGTPMTYGELDHYALTVQTGEDVVSEMFSLSQRTSRSLWILSATGAVLDVVLRKLGSFGGLLNFKA
ncbi:hypothetical protein ACE6H2_019889 [Prunus campanulata]